jgi:hypothetical protein
MSRIEKGILKGLREAVAFERGQRAATVRTHVSLGSGTVVITAPGYKGRRSSGSGASSSCHSRCSPSCSM